MASRTAVRRVQSVLKTAVRKGCRLPNKLKELSRLHSQCLLTRVTIFQTDIHSLRVRFSLLTQH